MKKSIFIDTNIFLKFYETSQNDLETLSKLQDNLTKNFNLYLTQQIVDEFTRCREETIKQALNQFKEIKFSFHIPPLCKDFEDEYKALIKQRNELEKTHSSLIKQIGMAAGNNKLKADELIQSIFKSTKIINIEDSIYARALKRSKLNNPPGKKGNLCDAINWEIMLENISNNTNLIIISDDGDYFSVLQKDLLHSFLDKEWREKKNSQIEIFRDLPSFFSKHIPILELKDAEEEDINNQIYSLENSRSFDSTHNAISKLLLTIEKLNESQINRIALAYLKNNQIRWIIEDSDVKDFINLLITKHSTSISQYLKDKLKALPKSVSDEYI